MSQTKFWKRLREQLQTIATPKQIVGISLAVAIGFGLGNWLFTLQSRNPNDPKLREQVLQIIRENPQVLIESVQAYQRQQQESRQKAQQSALQSIATDPKAFVGQSPVKGAANLKVLLVEFSDFQCPFCAKAQDVLKQFLAKYPDRVSLVYKHLPLSGIHPEAIPAAKAAWAAGQQGKFWEFHDVLFAKQQNLSESLYSETAKSLNLDLARFERDRNSAAATQAIEQDTKLADQLGIDGTPFFILNGKTLSGAVQLAELEAALANNPN
jgi:protein-disulfide isomerase